MKAKAVRAALLKRPINGTMGVGRRGRCTHFSHANRRAAGIIMILTTILMYQRPFSRNNSSRNTLETKLGHVQKNDPRKQRTQVVGQLTVKNVPNPAVSPWPLFLLSLLSLLSWKGFPSIGTSSPSAVQIWPR